MAQTKGIVVYYVEIRKTVKRGKPKFVPLEEVNQHTGFRSIVAYDAVTVERLKEAGNTTGMRGTSVYADTLFIDFDDHDPKDFREWLRASGLAHEEYHSGGRSIHFHIEIEPVFAAWVPLAMKSWVQEHAPTADVSFYHWCGQYRLPGTFHYKYPGQRKRLLHAQGKTQIRLEKPKDLPLNYDIDQNKSIEDLYIISTKQTSMGNRRPTLWLIATTALELGWDEDEILQHLLWVNKNFCNPPHDESTVEGQLEQAMIRTAKQSA